MEIAMIDFELIIQSMPALLRGTLVSLQITAIAAAIGISLGTLLGFCETCSNKPLKAFLFLFVSLIRGTPMLVQIFFAYYVLPQFGLAIPPFWAAGLTIGVNSSAYVSQIVRAGIEAIPPGQIEAAKTLGMTPFMIRWHIVFPQVIQITLPALGNELVTLVKDSSLASIIGVMELSKEASIIRGRTFDAFSILLAVSFIYLVLTTTLTLCINSLKKGLSYAEG